jgi:hypothetical protein
LRQATATGLKYLYLFRELTMSNHSTPAHGESTDVDVVESIVPLMPIVLPVGGGILIFLLAFIAVFMS